MINNDKSVNKTVADLLLSNYKKGLQKKNQEISLENPPDETKQILQNLQPQQQTLNLPTKKK
jgi:anti-anti-sigma regulatory factor